MKSGNNFAKMHPFCVILLFCVFSSITSSRFLCAQENRSILYQGQNRSYILFRPSTPPKEAMPLVFVLHGFTQNAQSIMAFSGFNEIADAEKFVVVYPNGINNSWNTNSGFPGGSTSDDNGFIAALAQQLIQELTIDKQRVYACGFSAGGFMSHILACQMSFPYAAIASVSGTFSEAAFKQCNPNHSIPVLQIHGTSDLIVPYTGSNANISVDSCLEFWIHNNSCPNQAKVEDLPDIVSEGSTVQRILYENCASQTEVEHLKVRNGGHSWPGARSSSGIGNTNKDIDASQEIWNFFKRFKSIPSNNDDFNTGQVQISYLDPCGRSIRIQYFGKYGSLPYAIYTLDGKPCKTGTVTGNDILLDLQELNQGTHILKMGRIATKIITCD